jgi:Ferritin-like domain
VNDDHAHPASVSRASDSSPVVEGAEARSGRAVGRRSFLKGVGLVGAAAAVPTALWPSEALGAASDRDSITKGDVAILSFLAAAEIIETDLWEQYNELGGASGGNPSYIAALENLDGDMPQYISDNTDDERSHAAFLNAYLESKGAAPVNLDAFRTLPSSKATGAQQIGRLTNLMKLNVDTSWYTRYRSKLNPDFGATFPQAVDIQNEPAIPLDDSDTPPNTAQPVPPTTRDARRMQAIANTAGFHFAMIEQGGSSLYTSLSLNTSSLEVLRIVVSIGGTEVNHFAIWHDKAGNAVHDTLAGVVDPVTGVTFPDLNSPPFGGEQFTTNLIMPEPCEFISPSLPLCSVIRPSDNRFAGARAAVAALTADGLFDGQSRAFFRAAMKLAEAADNAQRTLRHDRD